MSIASDVSKKQILRAQSCGCKLGFYLSIMNSEDKEALDYAIEAVRGDAEKPVPQRYFTIAWLTKVLNDNSFIIGKTVVSDHLRKACACDQSSE